METGCEPSLMLRRAGRFRHVCPLLKQNAQGQWLCSVDTPGVRPFWGRALGAYGGAFLLLYLLVTLAAWGVLRGRGYSLGYGSVVWPGAWSQFPQHQSRYFAERGQRALQNRDIPEALMAFSIAYEYDPGNYAIGRLLARLSQAAQPGLADRVYAQLVRDHAERRGETLTAWYEALLWRADFAGIIALARQAIETKEGQPSAWVNALLFAQRRAPNEALLRELSTWEPLGEFKRVFALELETKSPSTAARDALLAGAEPPQPFILFYRVHRLIDIGYPREGLQQLAASRQMLPARDLFTLQLHGLHAQGRTTQMRAEIEAVVTSQLNRATAELIAAFLIRHPDAVALAQAFDAFEKQEHAADDAAYRAWNAWLCAAGAVGDFQRLRIAAEALQKIARNEVRALGPVEAFFRANGENGRIEHYLTAMQPLPLDVTYALLERYYQPRPPSSASEK